jgi:hypothetical protein
MKLATAALLALGLMAGAANARPIDGYFTDLGQTAPRSVFDDINGSAPLQPFDGIGDAAPHAPTLDQPVAQDLTGE